MTDVTIMITGPVIKSSFDIARLIASTMRARTT